MRRLIHFFSLAVLTQLTLMMSQLVLLPIQVRSWGQSETAVWYSALALATVTYVVDCGLRTAGHAELMKASAHPVDFPAETLHFRQIWSWIRILILIVTGSLIAGDVGFHWILHSGSYPVWRISLILACALETILIIRITYLDSLGRYRGAEASYLCFAVMRLALSVPALMFLHWKATGLAGIYLVTAAVALLAQGHWLCRNNSLLQLTSRFPVLSLKTLALARHTVAEPVANWTRLSLPVIVISQIAPPIAVTTYVALRAVFGAARTSIQQLARVASVEFLKLRQLGQQLRAESILIIFVVAAVFFGSTVGLFVVVDNMRLLGLWLKHFDRVLFQEIALAFALTSPFFSYQIPMNLMFRTGELAWVARRHYRFVLCSGIFAGLSLLVEHLPLYLAFLVTAEMVLSISFFSPGKQKTVLSEGHSGKAGLVMAAISSSVICCWWLFVRQDVIGLFTSMLAWRVATSYLLLLLSVIGLAALLFALHSKDFSVLRKTKQVNATPLAVAE